MKSTHDILGGIPLPTCPFNNTALPSLETEYPFHILNPSTALFYLFFSFIYLSLAVAVWTKLSSLKIFNRKIKDYSILNRMLGIYFLLQSLAVFIDAIRYALNLPFDSVKKKRPVGAVDSQIIDNWLLLSTTLLRSTSILFLCFWLNNSRIYKSAAYGLKIFSKPDEENPVTRHLYVPTQNSTISGIFLPRRNVTRTDTPEEQEELLENDTQVEEIPMHKVILEIIVKIFYTLEFGFVLLFLFRLLTIYLVM